MGRWMSFLINDNLTTVKQCGMRGWLIDNRLIDPFFLERVDLCRALRSRMIFFF